MSGPRSEDCRSVERSIGVFVLGAIDPAERHAVESHIASCPRCTASLSELAPLPGLLHRLDLRDVTTSPLPPPGPSAQLRQRLFEAAQGERARRSRRRRAAVLGAAAALVVVGSAVAVVRELPDASPGSAVVSATDNASGAHADVRLLATDAGTQLTLRLTGVPPGAHCRLLAVDPAGKRDVAATWVASYAGRASVTGHTGLSRGRIASLLVVTSTGQTLVRVPIASIRG